MFGQPQRSLSEALGIFSVLGQPLLQTPRIKDLGLSDSRRPLLIIFLVIFIDLLGFGLVDAFVAGLREEAGSVGWMIGLLLSSFSAMQFLFAPLWGEIVGSDRPSSVLLVGWWARSFLCAVRLRVEHRAFNTDVCGADLRGNRGATIATAQAFIADSTPPEKRTAGMAIVGAAFGAGFVFGAVIGALCLWLDPPESSSGITGLRDTLPRDSRWWRSC